MKQKTAMVYFQRKLALMALILIAIFYFILDLADFVVDAHNDLPDVLSSKFNGSLASVDLIHLNFTQTNIDKLIRGNVGCQIWSAYISCKSANPVQDTLRQIDIIKRMNVKYSNFLELGQTRRDIKRIRRNGKIASLIGIEGGHQINNDLNVLRQYYELGVIYMTLTHTCNTDWADSGMTEDLPVHNGLATFGKRVVKEMNRLGMLVDISHVSHKTMRDVVAITKAPLFFSHSAAHALCKYSERNVPDDVLLSMKELDGVIMINFWPSLISCSPHANMSQVADHIEYIARLIGPEHIGIGADFDGVPFITEGLEDVSKYPNLFKLLSSRGFTRRELAGIMGGNFLRVLRKTEKVAQNWNGPVDDKTFE
jgi:membrane dipeptidase